jgi:hypothetical protein
VRQVGDRAHLARLDLNRSAQYVGQGDAASSAPPRHVYEGVSAELQRDRLDRRLLQSLRVGLQLSGDRVPALARKRLAHLNLAETTPLTTWSLRAVSTSLPVDLVANLTTLPLIRWP